MPFGKTATFTVTDAADVAVTALTSTQEIIIGEDASVSGAPTKEFVIKKPTTADVGIRFGLGTQYTFRKGYLAGGKPHSYAPGEIAGYVRLPAAAGSTTFFQDETGGT